MKLNKGQNLSALQWMPEGEEAERVLKARSKHLSQLLEENISAGALENYVHFKLGQGFYGIPFAVIKEIRLYRRASKVPNVSKNIAGIVNHQGSLLTIVNLKSLFGIAEEEGAKQAYLLVLSALGVNIGFVADSIEGSKSYQLNQLQAPLSLKEAIKPSYILGLHEGMTVLLNIEAIISDLSQEGPSQQGEIL